MKKILVLFMLALSLTVGAQVKMEGVVECENMTKEQVWNNVKKWQTAYERAFKSSIDSENKGVGIIVLKLTNNDMHFNSVSDLHLYSKLRIEIKDGKYKYSFYDGKFDFEVKDIDGIEYMSTRLLLFYKKQLGVIEDIARGDRTIPNGIGMTISVYSSLLKDQPKYKKPKDEKKGKINPRWEELNETVEAANRINTSYETMILSVINSLYSGVKSPSSF